MAQPSLLQRVLDRQLDDYLCRSTAAQQCRVTRVPAAESWLDRLLELEPDAAIVQADDFSAADYERLVSSGLLARIDLIFVSNGAPNVHIDRAMHRGVSYHLRLPVDTAFLENLLEEVYADFRRHQGVAETALSSGLDQFGLLVGSSPVMRRLYRVIHKAADTHANVFIVGESGTGKELIANSIHLTSSRSDKPFVAINCGALSHELVESELFGHVKGAFTGAHKDRSGAFEQAEGGTLFLDEITEMPLDHQVKLLRVLESWEYRPVGSDRTKYANVRVVTASNREPVLAIKQGLLREDLYFRLAHFPIHAPRLRDRQGDIVGLARHFLAYRNAEERTAKRLSPDAVDKIACHHWPGNVRQLKHAIERAYILADDIIEAEHLILGDDIPRAAAPHATLPGGIPLDEVEKRVILKTLAQNNGNKSETASQLGISVKTLYNKLQKYEIEARQS